jgi:hypothetical protein
MGVENSWFEFNPLPPSDISFFEGNTNFIPDFKFQHVADSRLQPIARWFSITIQWTPCLQ